MKKGIHPETYRLVAFKDMSNDQVFITRSCANTRETIEIEGVEYVLPEVRKQEEIVFLMITEGVKFTRLRLFFVRPPRRFPLD